MFYSPIFKLFYKIISRVFRLFEPIELARARSLPTALCPSFATKPPKIEKIRAVTWVAENKWNIKQICLSTQAEN